MMIQQDGQTESSSESDFQDTVVAIGNKIDSAKAASGLEGERFAEYASNLLSQHTDENTIL